MPSAKYQTHQPKPLQKSQTFRSTSEAKQQGLDH